MRMRRRSDSVTLERRKKALEMLRTGASRREIAGTLGVALCWISNFLPKKKKAKPTPKLRQRKSSKHRKRYCTKFDRISEDVVAAIKAGETEEKICAKFTISTYIIQRVFRELFPMSKGQWQRLQRYRRIANTYQSGATIQEVCEIYRCGHDVVRRALVRFQVSIRPRPRKISPEGKQKRQQSKMLRDQGWTLQQIGDNLSLSRERIRQLLKDQQIM
jgi:uncharacterized protein (DUF433 family)